MRVRLATLLALVLIALPLTLALSTISAGAAGGGRVVLAQSPGESDDTQGGETKKGEAEKDEGAEVGADKKEEEEAPAEEEEGPVWTYQMAWIVIGLLVLMGIGVALAYYKLVVQRQRAGV